MKAAVASLLFLSEYSMGSSWTYDDMSHWSDEYPMCGIQNGSPIDIKPYEAVFNPQICDSTFEWDVDYTKQTFKISNNGHSIALTPIQETDIDPDLDLDSSLTGTDGVEYTTLTQNENTIATLPNYFKPSSSEHDTWCLDGIHFHWGHHDDTGSEHLFDGHQYPLEAHFVHYSCAHASVGTTLGQFPTKESVTSAEENGVDTHQLGVVGIFFDVVEDATNPAFDAMFTNETLEHIMYYDEHESHATHTEVGVVNDLDLSQLIPDDIGSAGYYAYEGSLTTPPCTNIVRWHMMNARGYIGASQLELFRSFMGKDEHAIAPNYREVMENTNKVYSCIAANIEGEESGEEEESEEETESLSTWAVALIASLATAAVMGFIFLCVHKKQETDTRKRLHTNSFDNTTQTNKNQMNTV
eukprot:72377_1